MLMIFALGTIIFAPAVSTKTTVDISTDLPPQSKTNLNSKGVSSYTISNCQWIGSVYFCKVDAGSIHEKLMQITDNYNQDRYQYQYDQSCIDAITLHQRIIDFCSDKTGDYSQQTCDAEQNVTTQPTSSCLVATSDYTLKELAKLKVEQMLIIYAQNQKTVITDPTGSSSGVI